MALAAPLLAIGLWAICIDAVALDDRAAPLTDTAGDPVRGEAVFNDRQRGHCLLCHQLSSNPGTFQGNLGPRLDGVGTRLDDAQIRYRLIDSSRLNPSTRMPAYYRSTGLTQVAEEYQGKTVLTAQEIEDLVAYLGTQDKEL